MAASTRAATLHYCCNDREFAWGPVAANGHANHDGFARGSNQLLPQVLLIDAGCEWDNYASDSKLYHDGSLLPLLISLSHPHDARWQRRPIHSRVTCDLRARSRDANGAWFSPVRLLVSLPCPSVGLLQGDQTGPALGRSAAAVSPHTRTGLQKAWDFQR